MHEDFEDLSSIQTKYLWSLHTRSNDIRAELEKNTSSSARNEAVRCQVGCVSCFKVRTLHSEVGHKAMKTISNSIHNGTSGN